MQTSSRCSRCGHQSCSACTPRATSAARPDPLPTRCCQCGSDGVSPAFSKLSSAYENADRFPTDKTLVDDFSLGHHLVSHRDRLEKRGIGRFTLFCKNEAESDMCFIELDGGQQAKWNEHIVTSTADLNDHLGVSTVDGEAKEDPSCRFLFISAAHSRASLNVTGGMMLRSMTWHQVDPAFLDFLYPFGEQQYNQESCFNDFRASTRISPSTCGSAIPELGRSGRDLRLCYSLKAAEPSSMQPGWDWSVRQASIYHSFDVETGASNWIVVKGDRLLEDRIAKLVDSKTFTKLNDSRSPDRLLAAALLVHLLICDWATEHWRWYLNYMEEEAQQLTRISHAIPVDDVPGFLQKRRSTFRSIPDVLAPRSSSRSPARPALEHVPKSPVAESFKFSDLRRLLFLEGQVITAVTVMESDAEVITRMKDYYSRLTSASDWPADLSRSCCSELQEFRQTLLTLESNFALQRDRAKSLLKQMENQKTLLYGILETENIRASQSSASQALSSAVKMEALTVEMARVAYTTARQTAFMTLIAFVTVLYLPATFISTIWGTDIVQWPGLDQGSGGNPVRSGYDARPLTVFLAVSLPLTFVTIAACYLVYTWWARRTLKLREMASHLKELGERA